MRACTKKERLQKTDENRAASKKRVEEVQKRMANLKSDDWRENMREKLNSQKG